MGVLNEIERKNHRETFKGEMKAGMVFTIGSFIYFNLIILSINQNNNHNKIIKM